MTESTKTDDIARRLLDEAYGDDATSARHIPAPAPVDRRLIREALDTTAPDSAAPGITPSFVPEGYTLRETHRTNADGSTELIREHIPFPAISTPVPEPAVARPATAAVSAGAPTPFVERRSLPDWLTANRRRLKAGAYFAGATAVTVVGGVYGNEIAAAVTAGAAAVWAATVTVLKIVGVAVAVGIGLRIAFGGKRGGSRTGTFEGSMKGTWRQD